MRTNFFSAWILAGIPVFSSASLPQVPFAGLFGATDGAGAAVGWEREGLGVNPAANNPRTMGVSFAGYSPFGLDGVDVGEAAASWDGARWGTSLAYRGLYASDGESASAWQAQGSLRLDTGLSAGLSAQFQNDEDMHGFGGGAGILWNRFPFLTLGSFAGVSPLPQGMEFNTGIGADAGFTYAGYAWRISAEEFYGSADGVQWRFGALVRLHSLLSVYGGWSPQGQTMALGIRFGMGGWDGFSALRRHMALGTTSIQGLKWQKSVDP